MDDSPLSTLAPELRNYIYELVLTRERPFRIFSNGRSAQLDLCDAKTHPLALTATCKRIHAECTSMFFAANTFTICLPHVSRFFDVSISGTITPRVYNMVHLWVFQRAIGKDSASALRHLVLDLGDIYQFLWFDHQGEFVRSLIEEVRDEEQYPRECVMTLRTSVEYYSDPEQTEAVAVELDLRHLRQSLDDLEKKVQLRRQACSSPCVNMLLTNIWRTVQIKWRGLEEV